ncbi:GNAT family N-acetyltransferase [Sphingomonas sp.]|uniref:GNAT family N-acetyltransferase n=1 Tax=Sphingomonas sp. TaxID=28214 RepID=UPI00286C5A73|nr:GNAT family N-acetyltransferase [Sphingomonas sp.]
MDVSIVRMTADKAALLDRIADGVFNDPPVAEWRVPYLASPAVMLVVALDGDLVIGQVKAAIHLHPDKAADLYIDEVGVAATHQRRGIARRMLGEVEQWARERDCVDVWLAADVGNDAAQSLYGGFAQSKPANLYFWEL